MTTQERAAPPVRAHGLRAAEPGWVKEFQGILDAYQQAGGDTSVVNAPKVGTLIVSANRVLVSNEVPGVHFEAQELPNGVKARIVVDPGTKLDHPLHLCFGMLPEEGEQLIDADWEIGAGAQIEVTAHCTFPNAIHLKHIMDARIHVGPGAKMAYSEAHFHGPHGGIEVVPRAKIVVDEGGQFINSFSLVHGRVGRLDFDYEVSVAQAGVVELTTKAYGQADDYIAVNETLHLNGEGARGLTRTRIAVRDQAVSDVKTTAEGNAPFARGHMDCTEVVRGQAVARNMPLVVVRDDRAHVTHEAAIGTVNRKELETLLARGLDEETAVDVIIRGMLQ